MDRTLDDIEGRYVIVPAGEGVSLADLDKLAYPAMAHATGQERPAALFVIRPLRRDDPEGLDGSGRYDGGISFHDVVRTVNPEANPDVWTSADSAPHWHLGVSSPSTVDGFSNARVFAPTLPGAPPARRPVTTVSFEDMVRPIDPAALPGTWVDSREPQPTGEASPAVAGASQPWTFNIPFGAFDLRSDAELSSPRAPTVDPAPVEPSFAERIAALGRLLPDFRGGEKTASTEELAEIARLAKGPVRKHGVVPGALGPAISVDGKQSAAMERIRREFNGRDARLP